MMQPVLLTKKTLFQPKALRIDNYDKENLRACGEHIQPKDVTSDEDNHANFEELLQQYGFKQILRYDTQQKNLLRGYES